MKKFKLKKEDFRKSYSLSDDYYIFTVDTEPLVYATLPDITYMLDFISNQKSPEIEFLIQFIKNSGIIYLLYRDEEVVGICYYSDQEFSNLYIHLKNNELLLSQFLCELLSIMFDNTDNLYYIDNIITNDTSIQPVILNGMYEISTD